MCVWRNVSLWPADGSITQWSESGYALLESSAEQIVAPQLLGIPRLPAPFYNLQWGGGGWGGEGERGRLLIADHLQDVKYSGCSRHRCGTAAACNAIVRLCADLAVKSEKLSFYFYSELVLFTFLLRGSLVMCMHRRDKIESYKTCPVEGQYTEKSN